MNANKNNPMRAAHYRFNRLLKQVSAAKAFFRIGMSMSFNTIGEIIERLCEKVTQTLLSWLRNRGTYICYEGQAV